MAEQQQLFSLYVLSLNHAFFETASLSAFFFPQDKQCYIYKNIAANSTFSHETCSQRCKLSKGIYES